jgi:hypothetical protein
MTSSSVPRSSPIAAARLSMPTGPPSNFSMMVESSAVERVEALGSTSSRSSALRRRRVDRAGARTCGEVAHAAQQAVGDARRAARALGDLGRAGGVDRHAEDAGRAVHDAGQLGDVVELEPLHDAEAVAQRRGQQAGARGRADQRERRQVSLIERAAGPRRS